MRRGPSSNDGKITSCDGHSDSKDLLWLSGEFEATHYVFVEVGAGIHEEIQPLQIAD
jgi:hypothetical protein